MSSPTGGGPRASKRVGSTRSTWAPFLPARCVRSTRARGRASRSSAGQRTLGNGPPRRPQERAAVRVRRRNGGHVRLRRSDRRTHRRLPAHAGEPRFINDNVLTKDAVYFTDSRRPWFYRLPLGDEGELPAASDVRRSSSRATTYTCQRQQSQRHRRDAQREGAHRGPEQHRVAPEDRPRDGLRRDDRANGRGRDERRRAAARRPNALRRPEPPQSRRGRPSRAAPRLGHDRRPLDASGVQRADDDRQAQRTSLPAERALWHPNPDTAAYEVVGLG